MCQFHLVKKKKDLIQLAAEGVMVRTNESDKEPIDMHDVHGKTNLLILGM